MYLCFWREKNDAGEIVYTKSLLRNYILTRLHSYATTFIESLGFSHNHVSAFIKLIWDMHGTQKKLIFYRHFMNPRIAVRIPIKQIERLWVSATRSYIKGDEKLMWLLKPAVSNLRNVRQADTCSYIFYNWQFICENMSVSRGLSSIVPSWLFFSLFQQRETLLIFLIF